MMPIFSKGVPRWALLASALAIFALVPPGAWGQGPNLCLWRHLFQLSACPACGSTRALAAFFHGHFAQALGFNRNVIVTAPLLVGLLLDDLRRAVERRVGSRRVEKSRS